MEKHKRLKVIKMEMTQEELKNKLELHTLWLKDHNKGEKLDLSNANLNGADLTNANLSNANLRNADLRNADLRGADLDFSVLPLWCGSFGIKCDKRLFAQLAYHMCRLDVPKELKVYQDGLKEIAKEFHRYEECGEL
jgi:hypothetical protein